MHRGVIFERFLGGISVIVKIYRFRQNYQPKHDHGTEVHKKEIIGPIGGKAEGEKGVFCAEIAYLYNAPPRWGFGMIGFFAEQKTPNISKSTIKKNIGPYLGDH